MNINRIISLKAENVKRLTAVEIKPSGNAVIIGGKNGAGKSSVIDAIQYALGGDPSEKMPVRRGEEKAKIVVDLGDIIVKRTFTAAGGTTLVVTDADNVRKTSPQAILDKLVGKLTFDPLAFSREKPMQQAEILRGLVGLDFSAKDTEHKRLFDERTVLNREIKSLEARVAAMPKHEGVAEKEESAADIIAEQQKAITKNSANVAARVQLGKLRDAYDGAVADVSSNQTSIDNLVKQIEALTVGLETAKSIFKASEKVRDDRAKQLEQEEARVSALVDEDLSTYAKRISGVEAANRRVREAKQRADMVTSLRAKTDESETLSDKLTRIESDKRRAVTEAKYPVEGLMFDTAGGVMLNGIPFEQCSAAEQLKVSIAVGLALNPTLRILLIRDGSLLDEDSLAAVIGMAEKADAQVWIERVGTEGEVSVVIEDGQIKN